MKNKKIFKFKIKQRIFNTQVGEIIVLDRWYGNGGIFYDVFIVRVGHTWTFEESEMLVGHKL